jgi:acetyl esterase/lipase
VDDINAAGGHAQVFVYPGQGHAFMNSDPDSLKRMKSMSLILLRLQILPFSAPLDCDLQVTTSNLPCNCTESKRSTWSLHVLFVIKMWQ